MAAASENMLEGIAMNARPQWSGRIQSFATWLSCLALPLLLNLVADQSFADVAPSPLNSWLGRTGFSITGAPLAIDTNADSSVDTLLPSVSFSISASDVPAGAQLLKAYLYWGGTQANGGSADSSVRLTAPGGSPLTVTADVSHFSDGASAAYDVYLCRADVTSVIGESLSGTYGVDSYSGLISNNASHNASTAVLLIFSDSSAPFRQVILHDGLLTMANSTHTINLSGLDLAATPNGTVAYYTLEGDTVVTVPESVTVTSLPSGQSSILSDMSNPSGNPMNSTSNTMSPQSSLGVDVDRYNITAALTAHDTAIDVAYSAGGDKWWLGVNVTALDVALPGDYNHDGSVDAADFVVWRKSEGTPAEYSTWRSYFGQMAVGSSAFANSASVPEPLCIPLLLVLVSSLMLSRARR